MSGARASKVYRRDNVELCLSRESSCRSNSRHIVLLARVLKREKKWRGPSSFWVVIFLPIVICNNFKVDTEHYVRCMPLYQPPSGTTMLLHSTTARGRFCSSGIIGLLLGQSTTSNNFAPKCLFVQKCTTPFLLYCWTTKKNGRPKAKLAKNLENYTQLGCLYFFGSNNF
jgi:hypothetical protein